MLILKIVQQLINSVVNFSLPSKRRRHSQQNQGNKRSKIKTINYQGVIEHKKRDQSKGGISIHGKHQQS